MHPSSDTGLVRTQMREKRKRIKVRGWVLPFVKPFYRFSHGRSTSKVHEYVLRDWITRGRRIGRVLEYTVPQGK